jgi:glutamate synthase domain-containing protein 3
MARQCHLDTCPTGIATQREDLRAKFDGTPEQVVAFFTAIAEDVRHELAALGLRTVGQAVGRTDLLAATDGPALDVAAITAGPAWTATPARDAAPKDRGPTALPAPDRCFEASIVADVARRADAGEEVIVRRTVSTADRSIGARLAGVLARRAEPRRMPRVRYVLRGSAGQSFGAFAVPGMRITVEGEANDYVAKGLSGGTVVVRPDPDAPRAVTPALAGNVCLYGATGGMLHVVGRAGMRFAVRNSGARAVVAEIGAHGCEYMTGGTVVVLGSVGPNFGAGMTGGRAFIRASASLESRLNADSVAARPLQPSDEQALRELLAAHADEGSGLASSLLADWNPAEFVAVEPRDTVQVPATDEEEPEISLAIAR